MLRAFIRGCIVGLLLGTILWLSAPTVADLHATVITEDAECNAH